jgi:hypothetical protein
MTAKLLREIICDLVDMVIRVLVQEELDLLVREGVGSFHELGLLVIGQLGCAQVGFPTKLCENLAAAFACSQLSYDSLSVTT